MNAAKRLITGVLLAVAILPAEAGPWGHFGWGAEAGPSIDLTGSDMSTIDFGAYFGYTNQWLDIAGVGAGINMMMSNSSRSFPLYGIVRTSFTSRPSLVFADLRVGVALNSVYNDSSKAAFYFSPGVGFNLARGRGFSSYLGLSYTFNGMRYRSREAAQWDVDRLSAVSVRIGISF